MIDLFITTYKREEVFRKSFESLLDNTRRDLFRLTVVCDGSTKIADDLMSHIDYLLYTKENEGLAPSVNKALANIKVVNDYFDNNQSSFICYCQDDVVYESGWLEKLIKVYSLFGKKYNVGFVSGHNAPEHHKTGEIQFGKDTLLLKPWIRATNMFATREYFLSMFPIPRIDPETGKERGKPNNGLGSGVDWFLIRNHPDSVCRAGKINIVYPGLVKHFGYNKSTWLNRDLPEDER